MHARVMGLKYRKGIHLYRVMDVKCGEGKQAG